MNVFENFYPSLNLSLKLTVMSVLHFLHFLLSSIQELIISRIQYLLDNLFSLYASCCLFNHSKDRTNLSMKIYISDPLLDWNYIDFKKVFEYLDDLADLESQIEYESQREFKEFMFYNRRQENLYNCKGKYYYAYCFKNKGDVFSSIEDYKCQFYWPVIKGSGDYFDAIVFLHKIDLLGLPYVYMEIRSHLIFIWLAKECDILQWLDEKILNSLFVRVETFQWSRQSLFGSQSIDKCKYSNMYSEKIQ